MPRITIYFLGIVFAFGTLVVSLGACGEDGGGEVDAAAFCAENCENWIDCHSEEDKTQQECESDCQRDLESLQRNEEPGCHRSIAEVTECFLEMSCDEMLHSTEACGDELSTVDDACQN